MELTNNATGVSVNGNGFMDGLSDGAKEVVDKVSDILDIVNKGEGKPFLTAIKEMADKVENIVAKNYEIDGIGIEDKSGVGDKPLEAAKTGFEAGVSAITQVFDKTFEDDDKGTDKDDINFDF